jgi:DNA segregation ATPase FtsK/SpoIIIE-like protein
MSDFHKTPDELADGTERGKRLAYTKLATLTLQGLGVSLVAPWIINGGAGLPAQTTLGNLGLELSGLPFLQLAGVCSLGVALYHTLKRIPRRVKAALPAEAETWRLFVGRTYNGRAVYHDFDQIPHSKVAGATGSGKTKFMEYAVAALCAMHPPERLELIIIDLKGGASFAHFSRLPHVRGVYATPEEAAEALADAHNTMRERLALVQRARAHFQPIPRFPRLLIVIDEGGELSPKNAADNAEKALRARCISYLSAIARIGREPRVNILYGTQRPDDDTLPVQIRGQCDGTFCFRTENELDSGIVLRHPGAEKLPHIPGRYIYKSPAGEVELQSPYIPEEAIRELVRRYTSPEAPAEDKAERPAEGSPAWTPAPLLELWEG